MFKVLKKIFQTTKHLDNETENYLANSANLQELERRIRHIERGEAPFQQKSTNLLRGWS